MNRRAFGFACLSVVAVLLGFILGGAEIFQRGAMAVWCYISCLMAFFLVGACPVFYDEKLHARPEMIAPAPVQSVGGRPFTALHEEALQGLVKGIGAISSKLAELEVKVRDLNVMVAFRRPPKPLAPGEAPLP